MTSTEFVPLANETVVKAATEYFRKLVFEPLDIKTDAWIAGGCLREWLSEKRITKGVDIDVWVSGLDEIDRIKRAATDSKWALTKETDASLNFRTPKGMWVQVIKNHVFAGPVETIQAFDFTVCAFALTADGAFWMHASSLLDMAMKRLMVVGLQYPQSTLRRTYKYAEKGYRICGGELGKVVDAIVNEARRKEDERAAGAIDVNQSAEPEVSGGGRWNGLD